jgi:Holliday junction resolvase RusA-like endonuclease
MQHVYELHGKFKPYTRMTQGSKWNERSQAYLASQHALRLQFRNQMQLKGWEMLPGQTPLSVYIRISHAKGFHNRDLDNEAKGLIDSAQGVVFPDDRWIDELVCYREEGAADRVYMTVSLL